MGISSVPRPDRYRAKVLVRGEDDCWPWLAAVNPFGYGVFAGGEIDGERYQLAHRYGYRLLVGPIPKGFVICHRCDNPPCQNPAHWFAGTHADNMGDMRSKGRAHSGAMPGEDNPRSVLTAALVEDIRRLYGSGVWTQEALGREYGVSQVQVSRIVRGKRWTQPTDSRPRAS